MKRIIILISACLFIAASCTCCTQNKVGDQSSMDKKEQSTVQNDYSDIRILDETLDEPVKVIYQRNHMFSEVFETDDAETISELIDAINAAEIVSESNMAVDDYDDYITFVLDDGSTHVVIFEFEHLLKDGKRYEINGYERIESVLLSFAPENSEQ